MTNNFNMPSFDIVSQIDFQEVLNAINGVQREIGNRYDFKNVYELADA